MSVEVQCVAGARVVCGAHAFSPSTRTALTSRELDDLLGDARFVDAVRSGVLLLHAVEAAPVKRKKPKKPKKAEAGSEG